MRSEQEICDMIQEIYKTTPDVVDSEDPVMRQRGGVVNALNWVLEEWQTIYGLEDRDKK